mmetsp:Transcript_21220/g.47864  ORF Transcript_21220/g.47864 Transcript_21220/m.47864 type:complete len:222 (-) Transcript_21220:7205-7870(-)
MRELSQHRPRRSLREGSILPELKILEERQGLGGCLGEVSQPRGRRRNTASEPAAQGPWRAVSDDCRPLCLPRRPSVLRRVLDLRLPRATRRFPQLLPQQLEPDSTSRWDLNELSELREEEPVVRLLLRGEPGRAGKPGGRRGSGVPGRCQQHLLRHAARPLGSRTVDDAEELERHDPPRRLNHPAAHRHCCLRRSPGLRGLQRSLHHPARARLGRPSASGR